MSLTFCLETESTFLYLKVWLFYWNVCKADHLAHFGTLDMWIVLFLFSERLSELHRNILSISLFCFSYLRILITYKLDLLCLSSMSITFWSFLIPYFIFVLLVLFIPIYYVPLCTFASIYLSLDTLHFNVHFKNDFIFPVSLLVLSSHSLLSLHICLLFFLS